MKSKSFKDQKEEKRAESLEKRRKKLIDLLKTSRDPEHQPVRTSRIHYFTASNHLENSGNVLVFIFSKLRGKRFRLFLHLLVADMLAVRSGGLTRAGSAQSGERESAETGLNPAAGCTECASNVRNGGSPRAAPRGVQGHSDNRLIYVVLNSAGAGRP